MKKKRSICAVVLLVFVILFVSGCGKNPEGNWQGEMDMTGVLDDVTRSTGLKIDVSPLIVKVDLKLEKGTYSTSISPESVDTFKSWTKDYMGKIFDSLAASSGTSKDKLAKQLGYSSADAFINAEVESFNLDEITKVTTGKYKKNGRELIFDGKEEFPYIYDGDTIVGTFEGSQFGLSSDITITFYPVDK